MKKDSSRLGVDAALSPVPMFFVWVLWSWFCFFGIGIGVLNLNSVPDWMLYLMMIPLLISPYRCIRALVHGILHWGEKRAWLGVLLSLLGLLENALLIYGMFFIGSRF